MTQNKSLAGKVAVVTGASRGIGAGIAKELGRRGANIVITYNSSISKAQEVADQIRDLGSEAIVVQATATDLEAPIAVVKAAVAKWGSIDIIINNAAMGVDAGIRELTYKDWDDTFSTNVRFPVFLVKEALPHFGKAPRIVNISSVFARTGPQNCLAYASSKGALESMTRALASDIGHLYNATVNCVNPGPVDTDMWSQTATEVIEFWDPIIKTTPAAPRIGEVDDIAQIVAFLSEEGSRWTNGSVVNANGGMTFV